MKTLIITYDIMGNMCQQYPRIHRRTGGWLPVLWYSFEDSNVTEQKLGHKTYTHSGDAMKAARDFAFEFAKSFDGHTSIFIKMSKS